MTTIKLPALVRSLPALVIAMVWLLASCGHSAETDPCVLTKPAPMDTAAASGTKRYSLEEAAAKGLIEYEVSGTGNSSGQSLVVGVRRLADSHIDVYIRPGTVFVPGNAQVQRMVVWGVAGIVTPGSTSPPSPVTSMYLPDQQPRLYLLEAYCLDFQRENPSLDDSLRPALAENALDVRAVQVMYEGKRRELSFAGIQAAIWNDRDHLTKQDITDKFEVTAEEIDKAFKMVDELPAKQKVARKECSLILPRFSRSGIAQSDLAA